MNSHDLVLLFLQLAVMLAAALLFGAAARAIKMPAVLGEILGGILLGPSFLGNFFPDIFTRLFTASPSLLAGRDAVLRLGMLLFLFITGTEIQIENLRRNSRSVFWLSFTGILFPFASGFALLYICPKDWFAGGNASPLSTAIFLGTALSISALPVISRILMDLKLIQTDLGKLILSAAAVNDLIGWTLFSAILGFSAQQNSSASHFLGAAGFIFVFFLLALASEFIFLKKKTETLETDITSSGLSLGPTLIFILLAASLAEFLGIHAIFGAFAAGVLLSQPLHNHKIREMITHFAVNFFAPIYFVSIGLKLNYAAHLNLPLIAAVFLTACTGKILGVLLGGKMSGLPPKESLAAAFALNARGAMEIILASAAFETGLISASVFTALVFMALGTSLISGPFIAKTLALSPFKRI